MTRVRPKSARIGLNRDAVAPLRLPTAHDITERAILIRAQRYANELRRRPELIDQAKKHIERVIAEGAPTMGHHLWARLLDEPVDFVVRSMTSELPTGRLLRSNNPFSHIIGSLDETERKREWRQAKAELSPETT